MGSLVRAERTPIDVQELYRSFRAHWPDGAVKRCQAGLLVAHVWHETGAGKASFCWNLAGIKWVPGVQTDHYMVQTQEFISGKAVTVTAAFRGYPDLDASVQDYLGLMRRQFGFAWPAVEACDPRDFAHRLRARGYYTAPEQTYADAMAARYAQVMPLLPEDTQPDSPAALANGRPAYVVEPPERDPPDPVDV